MKVGDLVTFSSTGNKLVVVRETRKRIFKHFSRQGMADMTAFQTANNYTFLGIVLSAKGVSSKKLENIEHNYAAWALKRSMDNGARMIVMWSNVPLENSGTRSFDIRKGRDNYYMDCRYSLWKRGDLKKVKLNKKKK